LICPVIPSRGRRPLFALPALALVLTWLGVPALSAQGLSVDEQAAIFAKAAAVAQEVAPSSVIAIVDRDGRELLVRTAGGSQGFTESQEAAAVSKAGTAAFLSSGGEAFTTRTAGFIIQQHFPPGIKDTPPGPLVGVGFSSMAYSDVNYFRRLDGSRIPGTRLYGSPGGVPLYKAGVLVAGIGVTGNGPEVEDGGIYGPDTNEVVSLAGQEGFDPPEAILASNILVGGIRLTYVASSPGIATTSVAPDTTGLRALDPLPWPAATMGGLTGQVRSPMIADPLPGLISGQARLSQAEVAQIISNAAARALITRAGIRLPYGQNAEVFITVVDNPDLVGDTPIVLGTFRTPDATIFSWDVAVQKARTAVFFSDPTRAFSARTVGFLAQSTYPPGIDDEPPGPFNGLQERFSAPIISGSGAVNANLPNGITIFPGAFPLYRNGVLVGAVGVSGDGIDQDDVIAASGTAGFLAGARIRADSFTYLGARLPYAVFPRSSVLSPPETVVTGQSTR
jgi:uncharacterized protein GlcG (DUF336 family)